MTPSRGEASTPMKSLSFAGIRTAVLIARAIRKGGRLFGIRKPLRRRSTTQARSIPQPQPGGLLRGLRAHWSPPHEPTRTAVRWGHLALARTADRASPSNYWRNHLVTILL